jgi:hypothetical protein
MSPLLLGILLVLGGLAMVVMSNYAKFPLLVIVIFWLGIVIALVGAVLLLTPPLVWLNLQLRSAMNV